MKKIAINKLGNWTAITSFLIGTLLLLIFYFSGSGKIALTSYIFIIIAAVFNILVLLILIYKSFANKKNQKAYLKTVGLMLINIPVVLFYLYLVTVLLNTMRITFINETGKQIENIEINGCDPKKIEKMEIDESHTSWIRITGDCSISIKYKINGEIRTEKVVGYLTGSMGKKAEYRIKKRKNK